MSYIELLNHAIPKENQADIEQLMAEITYYGESADPEIISELMGKLESKGGSKELLNSFEAERFSEFLVE